MKRIPWLWFLLGFVLSLGIGIEAWGGDVPKTDPLDFHSGTTCTIGTPALIGMVNLSGREAEKMLLHPPSATMILGLNTNPGESDMVDDPGGTGTTDDASVAYYFAWRPLSSTDDMNDTVTTTGVTPFVKADGLSANYTLGGVSDVPSESTDIPPAERLAIYFVSASSPFNVPTTAELVTR